MTYEEFRDLLSKPEVIRRVLVHRKTGRRAHIDETYFGADWIGKRSWPIAARVHYYGGGFERIAATELFAEWDVGRIDAPPGTTSIDAARTIRRSA